MEDGSDLALKPRRINIPVPIAPVVRAAARSLLLAALLSRTGVCARSPNGWVLTP